jgi:integrating conjugative element relaxase (TIGR03760 family)
MRQIVGIPEKHWDTLYIPAIEVFTHFVQQCPASEAHHHPGPGGLLLHTIEVMTEALKLRRRYLLPQGADAEHLGKSQDVWTYAVTMGALLHDIGKPLVDQQIQVYDQNGVSLGKWSPISGPLPEDVAWYTIRFIRGRHYPLHERLTPLIASYIIPPAGLQWICSDLELLPVWLAVLSGDYENAGVLGEIIHQADQKSVAADLSGGVAQIATARQKPLAQRLITTLRHLITQELLPINRRGAAGWVVDNNVWLVSKRILDAIRDHMLQEGQTGIPTRNDRLMDELQQHGLLKPTPNEKAIWKARVVIEDWQQDFTLLCFALETIWPDPETRPPFFECSVIPTDEACAAKDSPSASPAANNQVTEEVNSSKKESGLVSPDSNSKGGGHAMPGTIGTELPLPPGLGALINTGNAAPDAALLAADDNETQPDDDPGQQFLAWLKDGLSAGRLQINNVKARIHTVPEGLLLVSPGIFRDFDAPNWAHTQQRFQKLKLHEKNVDGTNVYTYLVKGKRKTPSLLKGFLITNTKAVLGVDLPAPNKHLEAVAAARI